MAYNASRKSREKRLRAYYRKKAWTAGIVMLIIGLVLGFVACAVLVKTNDNVAALLGASPVIVDMEYTPTPVPVEESSVLSLMAGDEEEDPFLFAEEDPFEEPAVELTPVPTEEPTAEPTAVPTEAPTAEPTEEPVIEVVAAEQPTDAPTAEPTTVPTAEPTAVPTEEPTVEPTAVVTAEPVATPEPTAVPAAEPVIVAFGQPCTIQTEINADGTARQAAGAEAFETLDLTLQVKAYKDQAYYVKNYANSYILQGNEAAVEFDITLNGYTGATEIVPQNFLKVSMMGADASITSPGYQLIDAEIEGKPGIVITSDKPATVYKRYPYSVEQGDMVYMVVNAYVGGAEQTYWFEITDPAAEAAEAEAAAAAVMTIGSSGEEVEKLQAALIAKGLLSGKPDGKFGKYTAEAIKVLQGRYGMEQTGITDQAFLDKLYS